MRYDYLELTQEGGLPSNSIGSKYSAVCKALSQYKALVPNHANYIGAAARMKLQALRLISKAPCLSG